MQFKYDVTFFSFSLQIMAMNNSPSKTEYNGHSYEFVGKVPEELVCKLCSKVLREPRQVVCCGQHYCHVCIERRIGTNYTCPNCRIPSFNHFRDTHFEQRVNTLKIDPLSSPQKGMQVDWRAVQPKASPQFFTGLCL